ncbi:hypothetical protein [Streptomyces sp. NBC_01198]|uniref:hypothetical protein n=1 Tax=Streptomyces sp. NBC_01198 TaxID=2903769 RepID=UPI002E10193F|nr:hypothetical protein OG702_24840 [Streptomyces sp. NBC_01198]
MSESLLPYAVGAAKRARTMAVRVRRKVERMNTVPALGTGVRPRPVVAPVHLSVLGGRTLNVAVPVSRNSADPAAARLELIHGSRRVSVDLDVETGPGSSGLLTATVPLRYAEGEDDTSRGLLLSSGVWRFSVVVTDNGGRETRADLSAPAFAAVDGPMLPTSPSESSGAVFRAVRSVDGRAMLKVSAPAHQADLSGFDLRWDRVTVRGRLLAARHPLESYTAEVVRRGSNKSVPVPLSWDGDNFTFDLPLRTMTGNAGVQRTWDVQLRAGRTKLKVAKRLTQVRHPKQVFRTPFRVISLEDGSLTRVHAYLTPAGALAVACAAIGTNEDA